MSEEQSPKIEPVVETDRMEMDSRAQQEKADAMPVPDTRIVEAIAATLGVEPEGVHGWAVIVEYVTDESLNIRTLWSGNATPWQARGYAREMVRHTEQVQ